MRMSKLLSLGAAAFVFIAIISLALVPKHALAGGLYVTELETILGQPSGVLFRADPVTGSEISGAQLSDFAGPVRSATSIAFAPDGKLYVTELEMQFLGQQQRSCSGPIHVTGSEISWCPVERFHSPGSECRQVSLSHPTASFTLRNWRPFSANLPASCSGPIPLLAVR